MVKQHVYTRAIKSLYSNSAGYGSVAKSRGLDDEFVVEILEPLCKVIGAYFINFPDGYELMVIGNSIDRLDFTGDRRSGLFHNYIFDAGGIEQVMNLKYPGIISSFLDEYDEDCDEALPEIEIGLITGSNIINIHALKDRLSSNVMFDMNVYGDKLALQLLYAFTTCKKLGKKVYLGVCLEEVSSFSKTLFSYIISLLPFPFRTVIGFLSFSPDPQPHKGFDVIGVYGHNLNMEYFENDYLFIINPKDGSFAANIEINEPEYSPERDACIIELLEFLLSADEEVIGYLDYAADVLDKSNRDIKSDILIYVEIYNLYWIVESLEEKLKLNNSLYDDAVKMSELINYMLRMREKTGYKYFADDLLLERNLTVFNACIAIMNNEAKLSQFGKLSNEIKDVLINLVENSETDESLNYRVLRECFVINGAPDCVKAYETVRDIALRCGHKSKFEPPFEVCKQFFKWSVCNYPKDTSSESFQEAVDMFSADFSKELMDKEIRDRLAEEFKGVSNFAKILAPDNKKGFFKRLFNRGRFK